MNIAIILLVAAGIAGLWSVEQSVCSRVGRTEKDRRITSLGADFWGLVSIICLVIAGVLS